MKLKEAKDYFEMGVVTGFSSVRDPMVLGGWLLVVEGKGGRSWTLHTALGAPKSYASLDTLMGEIENIAGRVSSFSVTV